MTMREQQIRIKVVNRSTVLVRVLQAVKKRKTNISRLVAEEEGVCNAQINLLVSLNDEQAVMLKQQLAKVKGVVSVW